MIRIAVFASLILCLAAVAACALSPTMQSKGAQSATVTLRDGSNVELLGPQIDYGKHNPQREHSAIPANNIYISFEYIRVVEFGAPASDRWPNGSLRQYTLATITLIDGSRLQTRFDYGYERPQMLEGETQKGARAFDLPKVSSIAFHRAGTPIRIPLVPPTDPKNPVLATVTSKAGTTTVVSNFSFYFYTYNDAWAPPIITDVSYDYIPLQSGERVLISKVAALDFTHWATGRGPITVTLHTGAVLPVSAWFNPRGLNVNENYLMCAQGKAALGRFDIPLEEIKSVTFQQK